MDFFALFFFLKSFVGSLVSISSNCLINLSKSSSNFFVSSSLFKISFEALVLRLLLAFLALKLPLGLISSRSLFGFSASRTDFCFASSRLRHEKTPHKSNKLLPRRRIETQKLPYTSNKQTDTYSTEKPFYFKLK